MLPKLGCRGNHCIGRCSVHPFFGTLATCVQMMRHAHANSPIERESAPTEDHSSAARKSTRTAEGSGRTHNVHGRQDPSRGLPSGQPSARWRSSTPVSMMCQRFACRPWPFWKFIQKQHAAVGHGPRAHATGCPSSMPEQDLRCRPTQKWDIGPTQQATTPVPGWTCPHQVARPSTRAVSIWQQCTTISWHGPRLQGCPNSKMPHLPFLRAGNCRADHPG